MKTLDEIKQMMAAGDTAQADAALKELLAKEPNNLEAKMLYGTCRQLLGDEETFRRIHDELAPSMERMEKKEPKTEIVSLWKKYHALWMSLIVGGLVLTGIGCAAYIFGKSILNMYGVKYGGVAMQDRQIEVNSLYAGPSRPYLKKEWNEKKFTTSSDEDAETIE
jgi:hypothetical protein